MSKLVTPSRVHLAMIDAIEVCRHKVEKVAPAVRAEIRVTFSAQNHHHMLFDEILKMASVNGLPVFFPPERPGNRFAGIEVTVVNEQANVGAVMLVDPAVLEPMREK